MELLATTKLEKSNLEEKETKSMSQNSFIEGSSVKLIDILRRKTGSDYYICLDSLYSIIEFLEQKFPTFKADLNLIKDDILHHDKTHSSDNMLFVESFDAKLMEKYLEFISKRLGNKQESEWSLHEDYFDVKRNLNDFLAVIYNANPSTIRMKIREHDYKIYEMLVEMYRDEKRMTIRTLLLLCIAGLSNIDETCLKFICSSILPVELIREIYQLSPLQHQSHYITCLRVMSMLLANCQDISIQVISSLSKNFFANFLMKISPEGVFTADTSSESYSNSFITKRPNSISERQSINLSNLSIEEKYFLGQLDEAAFSFIVSANKHMKVELEMSPLVESIRDNLSLSKKILENLLVNFNWENDVTDFNGLKLINSLPLLDLNIDKRHFIDPADSLVQSDQNKFQRNSTIFSAYKRNDSLNEINLESVYIPKHPTRRFLFDLMRHSDIVKIFYRNDIEVAIRILLRHISDLSDNRDLLLEYLSILEILLANVTIHHASILTIHLQMINETLDLIKERSEDYTSNAINDKIKTILTSIKNNLSSI